MRSVKRQAKARTKNQERAKQLREQARDLKANARELTKDAKLDERASDLVEQAQDLAARIRASEAVAKAQARGEDLASKGGELAEKAREAWHDSGWDERAADMAKQVKESDQYQTASKQVGETTDKALAAVGEWISHGPAAEKLGVRPVDKKRTAGKWVLVLIGIAAGFAAGVVIGARKKDTVDEVTSLAGRLGQDTPDIGAPAAQKPIADEVRTRLGEDPRTSALPKLNVNVAEGTVFVRGAVPEGTDEDAIRAVVGTVPGVEDVDLQLSSSTSNT
jgi:osmotically-inducible protein OsmY